MSTDGLVPAGERSRPRIRTGELTYDTLGLGRDTVVARPYDECPSSMLKASVRAWIVGLIALGLLEPAAAATASRPLADGGRHHRRARGERSALVTRRRSGSRTWCARPIPSRTSTILMCGCRAGTASKASSSPTRDESEHSPGWSPAGHCLLLTSLSNRGGGEGPGVGSSGCSTGAAATRSKSLMVSRAT